MLRNCRRDVDSGSALYFVSNEPAVLLVRTLHCVDEPLYLPAQTKSHRDILFSMSLKGTIVAEKVMGGS